MSLKEFQPISKLGEGAYSSVYRVKRVQDGQEYALKKVKMMNLSEKEKENALNEVRILASVKQRNIIGYKEAFIDHSSNSLCIVMDFANNGDLYQKIVEHQKKGTLMPEEKIWDIFIQIVKGLRTLHDLSIYHRDLKSANVFLNMDGQVQLGDMNVSKVAKQGMLYTQTGTPYYASPEVWKDLPYDSKSDIWSLGCVLYEMTTLKPPFRSEDMEGLYKKVIKGHYPKIPTSYSQDLVNMIRMMLQVQPNLRPNCDKILDLPMVLQRCGNGQKEYAAEQESSVTLLNTIRIPKNLHYLTDRLPKANYLKKKDMRLDNSDERDSSLIYGKKDSGLILPMISSKKPIKNVSYDRQGRSIEIVKRDSSVISKRYDEDDEIVPKSNLSKHNSVKNQQHRLKRNRQVSSLQGSVMDIHQENKSVLNQILSVNAVKQDIGKLSVLQKVYNVNDSQQIRKLPKKMKNRIDSKKNLDYNDMQSELSLPKLNSSMLS